MVTINADQALAVLRKAEVLCSADVVAVALDRMANEITACLKGCDPVVLVVMQGALIPAALLFTRLDFPFQIDYLHVTRYRDTNVGGELKWILRPRLSVEGRVVLVVDDIFDEGITLKAILDFLRFNQARQVFSAVLVNKIHDHKNPELNADFVGVEVEDRYVFGCGMDYKGYWRNLPDIYAVGGTDPLV